jgi:hypothetical protein
MDLAHQKRLGGGGRPGVDIKIEGGGETLEMYQWPGGRKEVL